MITTCSQLSDNLLTICSQLANHLVITCSLLAHNLLTTCSLLAHNLLTTCSPLAHQLLTTRSLLAHHLLSSSLQICSLCKKSTGKGVGWGGGVSEMQNMAWLSQLGCSSQLGLKLGLSWVPEFRFFIPIQLSTIKNSCLIVSLR